MDGRIPRFQFFSPIKTGYDYIVISCHVNCISTSDFPLSCSILLSWVTTDTQPSSFFTVALFKVPFRLKVHYKPFAFCLGIHKKYTISMREDVSLSLVREKNAHSSIPIGCTFPFSQVCEEINPLICRRLDPSLQLAVSGVAILPLSLLPPAQV